MASINRFRGTPRARRGNEIQWILSVSNVSPDPDTDVGPTATLPTPVGLNDGDLVVVACYYRGATQNWSVSNAGGQSWIGCATHRSTTQMVQVFFCRFNGTWAAAPVFTVGSGTETAIAVLHAFRGERGSDSQWALDQSPLLNSGAGTGFTITGTTPQSARTLAIALVASQDDNQYTLTTPGRWSLLGNQQYRSTGGTDGAMAFARLAQDQATATGNLTFTQETLGADAGITAVLVFKEGEGFVQGKAQISRAPSRKAPGKNRRMFVAAARSAVSPDAGGGPVTGTLAVTLDDVTLSSSATLAIVGTAAITLDDVTLAAAGNSAITGTLSSTLADVTLASAGALAIVGTSAVTLGDVTLASNGTLALSGTLAVTLGDVTLAAVGNSSINATLAVTLADVTLAANGTLAIAATLATTLGDVTLASTGALAIAGTAAITLGDVTLASNGALAIFATLNRTLDDATLAATGTSSINATLAVTLDDVTLASAGLLPLVASLAVTLEPVTLAALGNGPGGAGVPSGGSGSWRRRRRMSR